jgi:hypothetical protein
MRRRWPEGTAARQWQPAASGDFVAFGLEEEEGLGEPRWGVWVQWPLDRLLQTLEFDFKRLLAEIKI